VGPLGRREGKRIVQSLIDRCLTSVRAVDQTPQAFCATAQVHGPARSLWSIAIIIRSTIYFGLTRTATVSRKQRAAEQWRSQTVMEGSLKEQKDSNHEHTDQRTERSVNLPAYK